MQVNKNQEEIQIRVSYNKSTNYVSKSTTRPIILRIQSQITIRDETEKNIYRNRKVNYLSIYKGTEKENSCS